jgi:hypothetical protein
LAFVLRLCAFAREGDWRSEKGISVKRKSDFATSRKKRKHAKNPLPILPSVVKQDAILTHLPVIARLSLFIVGIRSGYFFSTAFAALYAKTT